MSTLEVHIRQQDDAVIMKLTGNASLGNIDDLMGEFLKLKAAQPQKVVLDLAELEFIASLGMGALVAMQQDLKRQGGKLSAAALTDEVKNAFTRARLDQVFDLHDSVESALSSDTPA